MTLNEMAAAAHAHAVEKGFYDKGGPSPLESHALIHSEISEATAEVSRSNPPLYLVGKFQNKYPPGADYDMLGLFELTAEEIEAMFSGGTKPQGEAVELADAVIRIGTIFEARGWDMEAVIRAKMAFNKTRPQRHGKAI